MRRSVRVARKVFGLLFLGVGTLFFLWGAFDGWTFRDSLSPDGVTSHGMQALWRFVNEFSEFFYISVALWLAGARLLRGSFDA